MKAIDVHKEINGRLQDKFMFGTDYTGFSHKLLIQDLEKKGYKPEILEKLFYKNAQRILGLRL